MSTPRVLPSTSTSPSRTAAPSARRLLAGVTLAAFLAGCGGGEQASSQAADEQQAPAEPSTTAMNEPVPEVRAPESVTSDPAVTGQNEGQYAANDGSTAAPQVDVPAGTNAAAASGAGTAGAADTDDRATVAQSDQTQSASGPANADQSSQEPDLNDGELLAESTAAQWDSEQWQEDLEARVRLHLSQAQDLGLSVTYINDLEIQVDEGTVTLSGPVPTQDLSQQVQETVEQVEGVEVVRNELEVEGAAQPAE